jgi:nitroimidazol reductase NimA-like FMN-containing flavoprotein (pyridoxamine 5'-phosphate oxidase superfamily)
MTTIVPPSERTRIRRPGYAAYDAATVFAILDAGLVCHIAYVVEGAPYLTPTLYWRDGTRLYWHGSSAGRLFRAATAPLPVALAVSHVDALVLARSAIRHTMLFRSVVAFGEAALVTDDREKRRALRRLIDRLYPGRWPELRPMRPEELAATAVMAMTIAEASAKVKRHGVLERHEEDHATPVWAGVIPLATTIGRAEPDARLCVDAALPASLAAYAEHAALDRVLGAMADQQERSDAV